MEKFTPEQHWKAFKKGEKYTNEYQTDVFFNYLNETNTLHISYEESHGDKDWEVDFDAMPSLKSLVSGKISKYFNDAKDFVFIHRGYLKGHLLIREKVISEIEKYKPENIRITGYSYGGPMASLMHEELISSGKYDDDHLDTLTFGCVSFLWKPFSRKFKNKCKHIKNVSIGTDVAIELPRLVGYTMVGERIKLDNNSSFFKELSYLFKVYVLKVSNKDDVFKKISHGRYYHFFD